MTLDDFCVALHGLGLKSAEQALAILWFADKESVGATKTSGELARLIQSNGLGNPHSTKLGDAVTKSKHALKVKDGYSIKPTSRATVAGWVNSILETAPPKVDQDAGFIPKAVWQGTRGYVERIAEQINSCYQFGIYDGASVLIRRLVETLLIECYETLGIQSKIKQPDGNYPMLAEIIRGAADRGDLPLVRETKKILKDSKKIGDRSAHNRHYIAVKSDLDDIRMDVRLAVEELLHIAKFK
jgi:hypothetical protein